MPCYRCGTRQVDPVRGHSPWQRGVRQNQQVLVCPSCQATHGWTADLDGCAQCGSVRLVRRLGEVECRQCGHVVPPEEAAGDTELLAGGMALAAAGSLGRAGHNGVSVLPGSGQAPGLAEEVALALERVLGRAEGKRAVRAPLG